jgi:hypothetical protein
MALEEKVRFALPDGNDAEYDADQLAQMPRRAIADLIDYAVGARRRPHHDIIICAAGTPMAEGRFVDLYKGGIGENGTVWNTQAQFVKTDYHTSMEKGGTFPYGVTAVILAFELLLIALPSKAAAVGSGNTIGQITDAADHATQPTGYNPVQHTRAMLTQNKYQFQRGANITEENGLLIDLPATAGLSGFAGGAATGNLVQNNTFDPLQVLLNKPKVVRPNEDFFVRLTSYSALAIPVDWVAFFRFDTLELGGRVPTL